MASRGFSYQYDTNPRKINQEYNRPKSKSENSKNKKMANDKKNNSYKTKTKGKKLTRNENINKQKKLIVRTKIAVFFKALILFAIIFLVLFRNAKISESFAKIQTLKSEITKIQKENDQLEINIQNSINLNTIEAQAKKLLGMQKLTNKQIVYINLPKKDYVEHRLEEVVVPEEKTTFESILDKIKKMF